MRFNKFLIIARMSVLVAGLQSVGAFAAEEEAKYVWNGYGYWHVGQVIPDRDNTIMMLGRQWFNTSLLGLRITAKPSERFEVVLNPEFKLFFPPEDKGISLRRSQSVAYISALNGTLAIGDIQNPFVELKTGLFTYKYNPDVKDFGEYLFRTGTYPPFAINNFDWAAARLCGLNARVKPLPGLKVDALLTTELQYYPLYDFSLSFITAYSLFDMLDVGAGINLARLIPIDKKKTTSRRDNLLYGSEAAAVRYRTDTSDTGYSKRYSFQATKLMARASFDPKRLMPGLEFFGKEDLKLYGEIALTGFPVKILPDSVHPDLYGDISRLMPMVAGFNIPTFKLLDVLSVELEYFPSRMPNDYRAVADGSAPLPFGGKDFEIYPPVKNTYNPDAFKERDFGWAFYARKQVVNGFSIIGQIAYDHQRLPHTDGSESTHECMNKKGDWAWQSKLQYSF